jgi:hypothetical protein
MSRLVIALIIVIQIFVMPCVLAAVQRVAGTKVVMSKPEGFDVAPNFSGFYLPGTGASIMVTEIPGPFSKITEGFNAPAMLASRGMSLISKQPQNVGKLQGVLVNLEQTASGVKFGKWILTFGDEQNTVMVTAAYPAQKADEYSRMMKDVLLTVSYDRQLPAGDPQADLPFSIKSTAALKYAHRIQNMLLFTGDGKLGTPAAKKKMFLIGQALSDLDVGDQAVFARRRLKQTKDMTDFQIQRDENFSAGGLSGREIAATAKGKDAESLFVYQVILFGRGSYFILQGIAPAGDQVKALADFKEIIGTLKFK